MDITESLQPRSDQINADSIPAGQTMIVTISRVVPGKASQPYDYELEEFPGRAYRPGVTMRRVIAAAWGRESDDYVGRRMELYTDPMVRFGKEVTGGIRIKSLSHITKPLKVRVTIGQGRRGDYTVQPLPDSLASSPVQHLTADDIAACTSIDELRAMWQGATPDVQQMITRRVQEIQGQVTQMPAPEDDGGTAA